MVTRWAAVPLAGNRKRVFKDNERQESRQMKNKVFDIVTLPNRYLSRAKVMQNENRGG